MPLIWLKKQPENKPVDEIPFKPYNPTLLRNSEYLKLAEEHLKTQDKKWLEEEHNL